MDNHDSTPSIAPRDHDLRALLTPLLVFLALGVTYAYFITYGTFQFGGEDTLSSAYDSLAQSLRQGRANVDPSIMWYDGFDRGKNRFMYFGPLPAIIRIPFLYFLPETFGHWSRPSCLVAALLSAFAFQRIVNSTLKLFAHKKNCLSAILTLYFGLGTPLIYLSASSRIYHESILWALASSLLSLYFFLRWRQEKQPLYGFYFSFWAGCALLSKITFALPLYLLLGLALSCEISKFIIAKLKGSNTHIPIHTKHDWPIFFSIPFPAAGALILQACYNQIRFGSYFQTIEFHNLIPPLEQIKGVYNIGRLYDGLFNYLGFRSASFTSDLPFPVRVLSTIHTRPELFIEWKEETISLLISSPWLLFLASWGLLYVAQKRKMKDFVAIGVFGIQSILISSFYFITQRYAAEFLPLFVFLGTKGLQSLVTTRVHRQRILVIILHLLGAFSIFASLSSTLNWDANNNGLADFAKNIVLATHASSAQPPAWEGEKIYLSDLSPIETACEYAAPANDTTWNKESLSMRGLRVAKGLGMHAPCRTRYQVPANALYFSAIIGLPDPQLFYPEGSVEFRVLDADGNELYFSGIMTGMSDLRVLKIPVNGLTSIQLVAGDGGNGISYDHANWAEAAFLLGKHPLPDFSQ